MKKSCTKNFEGETFKVVSRLLSLFIILFGIIQTTVVTPVGGSLLIICGIMLSPIFKQVAFLATGKKLPSYVIKIIVMFSCALLLLPFTGCCISDNNAVMVSAAENNQSGETLAVPDTVKLNLISDQKKIKLSWEKAKNATGYELYFSEDGKSYEHLTTTNKLEYETSELTPGDKYYFKIKPYNSRVGCETIYGKETSESVVCIFAQKIDGYDVGDTYIHVDIDQQMMWFYKNNKLIIETPIVTGTAGACDTPTGLFKVRTKASPAHLIGPTWDVVTDYWIGINESNDIGIHDSQWRDTGYGGDIYTYSGSNGCINTPLDAVKKIYDNIVVGVPVVVSGSVQVSYSGDYSYSLETTPDTIAEDNSGDINTPDGYVGDDYSGDDNSTSYDTGSGSENDDGGYYPQYDLRDYTTSDLE